jgi:hypothetical protein
MMDITDDFEAILYIKKPKPVFRQAKRAEVVESG